MKIIPGEMQAKYIIDTLNEAYAIRARKDIYHWLTQREYKSEEPALPPDMAFMTDKEVNEYSAKSAGGWIAKELGIL